MAARTLHIDPDPLLETWNYPPRPDAEVTTHIQSDPLLDRDFGQPRVQAPAHVDADPLLVTGFDAEERKPASTEKQPDWDWYG